jgi:hypothetical protein
MPKQATGANGLHLPLTSGGEKIFNARECAAAALDGCGRTVRFS